jgi:protocatechuate 3,4-dioxygenase beta subunit
MTKVLRSRRRNQKEHMRIRRASQIISILFIGLLIALPAGSQSKQDKKAEAQLRTVHGSVLDKGENPVGSSIVYLVNSKTQAVRTLYAGDDGLYRFSGLDPNVDYEIHAEREDMTSATRTVSSYDSRRDIEVTLKLSKKKPAH